MPQIPPVGSASMNWMTLGEVVIAAFLAFASTGLGTLFWSRLNRIEDRLERVEEALAGKAEASALESLRDELATKVDKADLESLREELATKADTRPTSRRSGGNSPT
jgi:hypothetical protein